MKSAPLRNLVSASALVFLTLSTVIAAKADTIVTSSTAVAPITLGESTDTIALDATSVISATPGTIHFATGTFFVGDSPIPDQTILFSFIDSLTVNGITKDITVFGEDDVTAAADIVIVYAGTPIQFGDTTFTLAAFTSDPGGVGAYIPLDLTADVTATPEPSSIVLLGSGLLSACGIVRRKFARS